MRGSWLPLLWLFLGAYAFGYSLYAVWNGDGNSLLWCGAGLAFMHEGAMRTKR